MFRQHVAGVAGVVVAVVVGVLHVNVAVRSGVVNAGRGGPSESDWCACVWIVGIASGRRSSFSQRPRVHGK